MVWSAECGGRDRTVSSSERQMSTKTHARVTTRLVKRWIQVKVVNRFVSSDVLSFILEGVVRVRNNKKVEDLITF